MKGILRLFVFIGLFFLCLPTLKAQAVPSPQNESGAVANAQDETKLTKNDTENPEEIPIKTKLSSGGYLRCYTAKDEDFMLSPEYSSVVRHSGAETIERKYDALRRLSQKLIWKEKAPEPIYIINYIYSGENMYPLSVHIQDKEAKQTVGETYTEGGLLLQREVFGAQKTDNSADKTSGVKKAASTEAKTDTSAQKLLFTLSCTYDKKNRLSLEKIEYTDAAEKNEKTEYFYRLGGENADIYYYINDVIVRKKIYSTPDTWAESVFFPDSTEIIKTYESGREVKEELYKNGKKIRERKL